jgi:SagB-type dehydrogenase family enzyme
VKRAIGLFFYFLLLTSAACGNDMENMNLPKPKTKGNVSVEEAIARRRSVRSYDAGQISSKDVAQLLWACQGVTDTRGGLRAAPSAGALYPLEVYIAKDDGIFRYLCETHALEKISDKDVRADLAEAAYGQRFVADAPICIIIAAVYERVTARYGERGVRYTDMEAGHAAQNVALQAVALGLDSVPIGAFNDEAVAQIIRLPKEARPLYILPVGHRR